jgi:hypothetical protein
MPSLNLTDASSCTTLSQMAEPKMLNIYSGLWLRLKRWDKDVHCLSRGCRDNHHGTGCGND